MTAFEINAEVYRSLGLLAKDEDSMKKVLKFVKKLVEKKEEEKSPLMTKSEILESLDNSFKELKLSDEGKIKLRSAEELLNEL